MHIFKKSFAVALLMFVVALNCYTKISFSAEGIEGMVNINTATEAQIALLPGIGSKLAAEVLNYRTSNGDFKTIDDLKKIKGIGDKKLEAIRNFVALEGDTTIKSTKAAKDGKEQKLEESK